MYLSALAAVSLVTAACSDDGLDASDTTTAGITIAGTTQISTSVPPTNARPPDPLDFNRDGDVVFGVATTGPADGGGWSQGIVDAAKEFSILNSFAAPIVIDRIRPEDAATLIGGLAQQGVDIIVIGAAAIALPLADVIKQNPDIYWYCNCGAGIPEHPGLAQSTHDGAEIGYTAGFATGLLLEAIGERRATIISCCDLGFEKQLRRSFEDALRTVDDSFRLTYVRTGTLNYDFDNTTNAQAAFRTAVDERNHAVLPFLDGAHRAVVTDANVAGVIALSAGSSTACDDSELAYGIAVRFDGGDYLRAVLPGIIDGSFSEGQTRTFKVGVDPQVGAIICNPSPEQQAAMDDLYVRIAAGEFAEQFAELTLDAFADEVDLSEDLLD
ncbi:MAG: hypothetical protein ABL953_06900 [Ilumatobacteraceae bacterium]